MNQINIQTAGLPTAWAKACSQAVEALNKEFAAKGVAVRLVVNKKEKISIPIKTDANLAGTAISGSTHAAFTDERKPVFVSAEVKLPVAPQINTPGGVRTAGAGVLIAIVAHEIVHALGHVEHARAEIEPHNTHLMTATMRSLPGDTPAEDKLIGADGARLPPILLSAQSIDVLKLIWN